MLNIEGGKSSSCDADWQAVRVNLGSWHTNKEKGGRTKETRFIWLAWFLICWISLRSVKGWLVSSVTTHAPTGLVDACSYAPAKRKPTKHRHILDRRVRCTRCHGHECLNALQATEVYRTEKHAVDFLSFVSMSRNSLIVSA